MDEEYEKELMKCNGMSAVRKVAKEFERAPTVDVPAVVVDEEITVEVDDVIAVDIEKGDDEQLLAEERDTWLEVVGACEVPTIEVDDGIAGDNERGDGEQFIAEGRDA